MIYQYVVTLKRNNDKYIDNFSILLCFISIISFVSEQIKNKQINYLFIIASVILFAGICLNLYNKLSQKKIVRYRYLLFAAGICWLMMPYLQWFCVPFFLLSFLEYQAKYPLEVGFTNEQVVINTLFKRKFTWIDFNNIILKDGLLTLDFKNNTLFQKEAIEDDEGEADEDEFNDYCRERLGVGG
jgi:hypothetical protein